MAIIITSQIYECFVIVGIVDVNIYYLLNIG